MESISYLKVKKKVYFCSLLAKIYNLKKLNCSWHEQVV